MIEVSLNNEPVRLPQNTPLDDALAQWHFVEHPIAVAINGEFVPRTSYPKVVLQAGDLIDIVRPVGGG